MLTLPCLSNRSQHTLSDFSLLGFLLLISCCLFKCPHLFLPNRMGFSLEWWGLMTGGAPCYGLKTITAFFPHGQPWKMSSPLLCKITQPTWVSSGGLQVMRG